MSLVERLAAVLAQAVSTTGPYGLAVLFLGSLVEYVFPPFPGDMLVLFGAWYAVEGVLSWPLTFLAVTAGAVAGAFIDYRVGAALGPRLDRRAAKRGALSHERLERFEAAYRRHGALFLLANRFLPGVRAFLFLAAGASGIPVGRVLLYGGISAALWNAVLLGAGALLAKNVGELQGLFEQYARAVWVALAAAAVLSLAVWRVRARRGALGR
jgi:membrane-associated protein